MDRRLVKANAMSKQLDYGLLICLIWMAEFSADTDVPSHGLVTSQCGVGKVAADTRQVLAESGCVKIVVHDWNIEDTLTSENVHRNHRADALLRFC